MLHFASSGPGAAPGPPSHAYLVIRSQIRDPKRYESARRVVGRLVEAYGGRFLARTDEVAVVRGKYDGGMLVLIEFPTMDLARRFAESPENAQLRADLSDAATSDVWLVPGI